MKALAIDFETANESRTSACAIGLAWIENGAVTRREHRLIRPREMRFNYHNIKVHGIRPEDVKDQPEFPDVIAEFLPDFAGGLVLAHNASFDIGVLCASLREYGLRNPEFGYFCTVTLSRHLWPELGGASLDVVARHFGIQFRHHDASEDAFACAQIALIAARQMGLVRMSEVFPKAALQLGRVHIDGYVPCTALAARKTSRPRSASAGSLAASPTPALNTMLHFAVKGRTGTYQVTAQRVARALRMTCSCQAGRNRIWCWHRTTLLDGVCDDLLSDNPSDLAKLAVMAAGADIEGKR